MTAAVPTRWQAVMREIVEYEEEREGKEREDDDLGVRLILDVLTRLHTDSHDIRWRALANYRTVYGDRVERAGFRKSERKARLAAAFAVANTLAREGMPRPVTFITQLCGLERDWSALLDLPAHLKIAAEEMEGMSAEDYELHHSTPSEFVDVVCACLGVPFHLSSRIREETERIEWALYDRSPTTVVAAMLQRALASHPADAEKRARICEHLDCSQPSVDQALQDLRRLE